MKNRKKRKRLERIRWQKSWTVTMILILQVAAVSFLSTCWINKTEEKKCFEQLYEEADKLVSDIEWNISNDREMLEMLALVAAGYEDPASPELWRILDSCHGVGLTSRIEMLLPDDTVLTSDGRKAEAEGILSFQEESARGAHVSGRERDLEGNDGYIVRNYVPVVRNGDIAAMLYGVVDPSEALDEMDAKPYGGKAAVYVIEGESGDFLVDTWHNDQGNIWELGERKMAPGYDHEQLKQGLSDGESGYVVFVSDTIQKYLYFYYEPIAVNDWRLALSVSEDVVFADADQIQKILNLLMVIEGVCLATYFVWMLRHIRNEIREKQRQMDIVSDASEVQKLLFNAHESHDNIVRALEKVGQILGAGDMGFWMFENSDEPSMFTWTEDRKSGGSAFTDTEIAYSLLKYFKWKDTLSFEARDAKELQAELPGCRPGRISNLAAVAVEGKNGTVYGVLAGANMQSLYGVPGLLKNVSLSFSMLANNVHSFNAMRDLGEKDILTGLYNRNRYEMDVREFREKGRQQFFACIYVDVNGLHELNNEEGHAAGDKMLQIVAEQIRKGFGTQYTYRIGGDEFVVLVPDLDEKTISDRVRKVVEKLRIRNISVSAGVQWENETESVDMIIKAAEKKMYDVKKKYYEQNENKRNRRNQISD